MADRPDEGDETADTETADDDSDADWFERAIRQEDDETDGDESERRPESDEAEPADESETVADPDTEQAPTSTQPTAEGEHSKGFGFDTERDADSETSDDDFDSAFDDPGDAENFGFDVDAEGGETFGFDTAPDDGNTFDDEALDSDIPRIDLGIGGLDEMIQGGVPERSLIVAIGGAGTGKTTFGLQFLAEALDDGERAVFITLEESHDRILQSAEEKGWAFERYESEGQLAIIDLDPIEMANSLASIRNELPRLVEAFGASRLVLDSVSLLEMMYDEQAVRRTEIYDFTRSLKEAGVSTLLTSEADADNLFSSRYGIIEYLTDAVFVLRHVRPEDFRETRLAIEIQKIRDANHSRETKPYEITDTGISVYRQANIF